MANTTGQADKGILEADRGTYDSGAADAMMYTAFDEGFSGGTKALKEKAQQDYQIQQTKYNQLLEAKPQLISAYLTDQQIDGLRPVLNDISNVWSEQASILSQPGGKDNLKAQNRIQEAASYIANIENGNQQLYKIREFNEDKNGDFSLMLNDEQRHHIRSISNTINGAEDTGVVIEYPKKDGYHMKVTMPDGTVYDRNNPIPQPQGEFVRGRTGLLNIANTAVDDGGTATAPMNAGVAANNVYNEIINLKSDYSDEDGSITRNQKKDLFFRNLTPDGEDISYAQAFLSGNLPREFYLDENKRMITLDSKSDDRQGPSRIVGPRRRGKGVSKLGIPFEDRATVPAFGQIGKSSGAVIANWNGSFQWNEEEVREYLTDNTILERNLKQFSKYYGGAVAQLHNDQFNLKKDRAGQYLMGMDGHGSIVDIYGDKTDITIKKRQLYSNMIVDRALYGLDDQTTSLLKNGNYDQISQNLTSTFAGTGITVGKVKDPDKKGKFMTSNFVGVKVGDKQQLFDISKPGQVKKMKLMLGNSNIYNQLSLSGNPETWRSFDGSEILFKGEKWKTGFHWKATNGGMDFKWDLPVEKIK